MDMCLYPRFCTKRRDFKGNAPVPNDERPNKVTSPIYLERLLSQPREIMPVKLHRCPRNSPPNTNLQRKEAKGVVAVDVAPRLTSWGWDS